MLAIDIDIERFHARTREIQECEGMRTRERERASCIRDSRFRRGRIESENVSYLYFVHSRRKLSTLAELCTCVCVCAPVVWVSERESCCKKKGCWGWKKSAKKKVRPSSTAMVSSRALSLSLSPVTRCSVCSVEKKKKNSRNARERGQNTSSFILSLFALSLMSP